MHNVMGEKLIIFGAGGHAVKMAKIAIMEQFDPVGYISTEPNGTNINGLTVFGNIDFFLGQNEFHQFKMHIGIGENIIRQRIFNILGELNKNIVSIKSQHSIISSDALIQRGVCVVQSAVIQNNVKIGKCCIIDTASIVDHDSVIGDFVNISPNSVICSHVKIGNGVFIGAGSTVIDHITIGENSVIGAGSVVVKDIGPNVIAYGNPANVRRKRNPDEKVFK
ncbi:MAG TPA: hypothetical protein DF296_15010 [Candidatus Margulisbacteria bacterium]|nr:hypothetical protein [Candidatus Margulisiibacteriota bacterium]